MTVQTIELACPVCGKKAEYAITTVIDAQSDREAAEKALDMSAFRLTCPACGHTVTLSYGCVYENREKEFTVALVPGIQQKTAGEAMRQQKRRFSAGWRYRMTPDANAFAEKIRMLENGRDDRVVELCKYFVYQSVTRQMPDRKILALYYDTQGGGESFTLLCQEDKALSAGFTQEMYQAAEQTFAGTPCLRPESQPVLVDAAWAAEAVRQMPEE